MIVPQPEDKYAKIVVVACRLQQLEDRKSVV